MASLLSGLFGRLKGSDSAESVMTSFESEEYKGYIITPAPHGAGGQFNTAGIITRTVGDEVKEHRFIRADTHSSPQDAARHAVTKAQQIIDEQGDAIFG